jgi:hypothetical protein
LPSNTTSSKAKAEVQFVPLACIALLTLVLYVWGQRESMSVFVGEPLLVESGAVRVLALFADEPLPEVFLDALSSLTMIIAQAIQCIQAEEDQA